MRATRSTLSHSRQRRAVVGLREHRGFQFGRIGGHNRSCVDDNSCSSGYELKGSPIHGIGVFAKRAFSKGDDIGVGITWYGAITDGFGTMLNHKCLPNATLVYKNWQYVIVATENIAPKDEITINYCYTPWFIRKPDPQWGCLCPTSTFWI